MPFKFDYSQFISYYLIVTVLCIVEIIVGKFSVKIFLRLNTDEQKLCLMFDGWKPYF